MDSAANRNCEAQLFAQWVRKDAGNKSKSDKQSPFTLFVWELQKCLPKGCKYPTQSKSALAKAIGKARRADASLAKALWKGKR